jgi:PAS domain S-box-containing protein
MTLQLPSILGAPDVNPGLAWGLAIVAVAASVAAVAAIVCNRLSRRRMCRDLAARQSDQARLRALLQQMPSVVWSVDTDLRFTSSDGAALEHLDSKPNEVVGLTLYDYFKTANPNLPPIAQHLRALRGQPCDYEFMWNGHTFLSHLEPLRDHVGRIVGVIGAALDITRRKAAEEALARSEIRNRALLTAIPDVMFRLTRDGRLVEFIDKLLAPSLDYAGRNLRDVFPAQVVERLLRAAAEALDGGETQILEYHLGAGEEQRFFEARFVASGPDEVLAIVRNITERKQAENEVRRREAQLQSLVKAIPDLIFQLTLDGRVASCHAPADSSELLLSPDQFLGRPPDQVLPPRVAALIHKHIRLARLTRKIQVFRHELQIRGETWRFEARLVWIPDDPQHVTALVRNITNQAEEAFASFDDDALHP